MSNREQFVWVHWLRIPAILIIVATLLFSVSAPALAISFGEPDGDDHPFVGSIIVSVPGLGLYQ